MFRLVVFLALAVLVASNYILRFKNPKVVTALLTNQLGENGVDNYTEAILPHNNNTVLKNPVYEVKELNYRYLQLCIESKVDGASISAQDNEDGPVVPVQGRGCHCWYPGHAELKFEFFCTDSCQTTDTVFVFRFIKSEAKANDKWCSLLPANVYPSDLRSEGPVVPDE